MRSFNVNFDKLKTDIEGLENQLVSEISQDDLRHTKFWEKIGKCCTVSGFLLAAFGSPWLIPIAALLIVQGMGCRAFLAHHTGHSAYDNIPGADKYFRSRWGVGKRRFIDCFSLFTIEEDRERHEKHHQFTNTRKDPNALHASLNLAGVNSPGKRKRIFWIGVFTWIWQYYAPSMRGVETRVRPLNVLNFELLETIRYWTHRVLPYIVFHFTLLPLLFAPWGTAGVLQVLAARILADLFLGAYMYLVGVTNHIGSDLYKFKADIPCNPKDSKGEWYLQQILSTTGFASRNGFTDYLHCFMNFQIEHHLMPNLPPSKYRKAKPEVMRICKEHGIPYVEENIFKRFLRTKEVFLGEKEMKIYVREDTIR